jgi:gluconate 2-dehydrogenase gamma chain
MSDDRKGLNPSARRSFLKGTGAALALGAAAAKPTLGIAQIPPAVTPGAAAASAAMAPGYQSLGLEESATTEALVDHMWPADQFSVSGTELGIATYIDRQLAGAFGRGDRLYAQGPFRKGKAQHGYQLPLTPEAWYKAGIAVLNTYCTRVHGRLSTALPEPRRETALRAVSAGRRMRRRSISPPGSTACCTRCSRKVRSPIRSMAATAARRRGR